MRNKKEVYLGAIGTCTNCQEWTSVLDPCCDAPVLFEGELIYFDDFESKQNDRIVEPIERG